MDPSAGKSDRPVVAHLSTAHTWNDTRVFQRMCRSLAKQGFDVHWVVPTNDWSSPTVVDGVTIHPVPRRPGRFQRATRTAARVFATTRSIRPDLCHFHDPELIWVGLLLRSMGYQVIFDIHENFVGDVLEKEWVPRWLRRPLGWTVASLEAMVGKICAGLVTAGKDIQLRLAPYSKNCVFVGNFPDLEEFPELTDVTKESPPQILFLGGINLTKIPWSLIHAIELVPDDLEFEFVWGGKRAEPTVVQRLEQRAGWKKVKFVGNVPFQEVNQLMHKAHAAVVLYADAPNNYSVRSNRLFESMAVGLPVIGPRYGDWNAFFVQHKCGIAVDPHNPQEIADALERVLRKPNVAAQMGAAGRQAIEQNFSWSTECERLVQLYEKLIDR